MGRLTQRRLPTRPPDLVPIKVSAAHARYLFHGCDPDYIANVCHGACCTMKTQPLVVVTTPEEARALRAQFGRRVAVKGVITPTCDNRCPFHTDEGLCSIHFDGKPTGCHESPWTLTVKNTLIVRNRYRRLVCFTHDGLIPAYQAFADGLTRLFGEAEAARITVHLEAGGGDLVAYMSRAVWERVTLKNVVLRA